ncbi:hypothetical protein TVAG_198090 [Trichomonas vaginalis G3]|uniref:COPI associated protein n=1 Tax=Trichomonas vaginalis (strain ATCC PRA-98 / G3) TaxID=412133 RepID=A2DDJ6_TRIV3|nr:COPI associated protein family [Trichomonas vaginalis G3]EAY21372.1 hypothetical protein TVAG_198090 [Trichomonas vaginalis G3]KAI5490585.1 COPI associated protein family [Trichomonas vaginalis G3]|eukprot:XP_001582358.1 hypothetical protein [Trichomonas vaginalis G3]
MAVVCNIGVIAQIITICAGAFALVISFILLFKYFSTMVLFQAIFGICLGLTTILCELYIFDFFKYFAFLFRAWGKCLFFLFVGVNFFSKETINIITFAVFMALAIFYAILCIVCGSAVPVPLLMSGGVKFEVSNDDYKPRKERA